MGQVPAAAAVTPLAGSTVVSAGITPTLKTFNKFNPRDRLKRKMQILLNKQCKWLLILSGEKKYKIIILLFNFR